MFSRSILPNEKTEQLATHQRLDKAARHVIANHLPKGLSFPSAKEILHFEGINGPDGLASKKGKLEDEPYQFIQPDFEDDRLLVHLKHHLHNLHKAIEDGDRVRMAFEASWMGHMVVDGLSPPHHQPFKQQLRELDTRNPEELTSQLSRIMAPGTNIRQFVALNWKRMGPKGIGTNHVLFEMGVELIIMPRRSKQLAEPLSREEVKRAKSGEYIEQFKEAVLRIDSYNMFGRYEKSGWTEELARDVQNIMIPEMVKMVALGWIAGVYKGE